MSLRMKKRQAKKLKILKMRVIRRLLRESAKATDAWWHASILAHRAVMQLALSACRLVAPKIIQDMPDDMCFEDLMNK